MGLCKYLDDYSMVEATLSTPLVGSLDPSLTKLSLGNQPLCDEEEETTRRNHTELFQWRQPHPTKFSTTG